MRAMILAGGDAARLRPLTVYTPNPLVPIANQPLLKYQIEILRRASFREMTLVLGYHSNKIEDVIGDGREQRIQINYQEQSTSQGTAGAFRSAMGSSKEPAVVIYGDILTDLQLDQMIAFHREKGALVTIAMVAVENPSNYGMIEAETDGRMTRFVEKPSPSDVTYNTINAGIYVIEPAVLDLIPVGEKYSFEEQLFPRLIEAGKPVYAYSWSGYWKHLGNVRSYLEANLDRLAGRLKGLPAAAQVSPAIGRAAGETTENIEPAARIDTLSQVDPTCTIKPGAEIINSVIGPGCFIEERARIQDSVLLTGVRIGKGAEIRHSFIGKSSIIGRQTRVAEAILGDKTSLADYSVTGNG
jgi:NDP-sugar pyrophosphorylase family protein